MRDVKLNVLIRLVLLLPSGYCYIPKCLFDIFSLACSIISYGYLRRESTAVGGP